MNVRRISSFVPASLALAVLTLPSVAAAGTLPRVQWRERPIVSPSKVANGQLKDTAPFLGIRTPKNTGGYTLNPVCKVGAKIFVGRVEYDHPKYRVVCPEGGEVAVNHTAYTTEPKQIIEQRGRLSLASLTYKYGNGQQRIICYGKVANQKVPGWMDVPEPGTVPEACNVQVFGTTVPATDYGVFKHKNPGALPTRNGWWTMSNNDYRESNLPIFAYKLSVTAGRGVLCRGKQGTVYWPGKLELKNNRYKCKIYTTGGPQVSTQFDVFLAPAKTKRPFMSTGSRQGHRQDWDRGLNMNNASMPTFLCRQGSTRLVGVAVGTASQKKCVVNTTAASKTAANMDNFSILHRN